MSRLVTVLLTKYCSCDKIEKNEMGWACSTYGKEKYVQGFGGKPGGRRPLGRPRRRWEDSIKTHVQVGEWGDGLD